MTRCQLKVVCSVLFILSISTLAYAQKTAPLVNYENVRLSDEADKAFSLDDIGKAIAYAAVMNDNEWKISNARPGYAMATLVVRNKHTAIVDITYTEKTISIMYKDSINLNYDPAYKVSSSSERNEVGALVPGTTTDKIQVIIHPNYNKWVAELLKSIRKQLRLQAVQQKN